MSEPRPPAAPLTADAAQGVDRPDPLAAEVPLVGPPRAGALSPPDGPARATPEGQPGGAPDGPPPAAAPPAAVTEGLAIEAPPTPIGTATLAPAGPQPPTAPPVARPPSPRRWPGPVGEAPPAVLVGAMVAGVAAAAGLTWDRPGIGWLGTAVVATIAIVVAAWRRPVRESRAVRIERTAWAAAAVVLLASGAFLAAEWLFVLAVLAALVAAAISFAGGTTAGGLILSVLVWPVAAVRAISWTVRGLASQRVRGGASAVRVVAAAVIGLVLLLIFGALFAGADAAFARLVDRVLPTVDVGTIFRWIWGFGLVAAGTLAACFLAFAPPVLDGKPGEGRPLRRIEWGLPIGALVLLFTAFVTVQATVLFGGDAYVQRTAGLTYAEYARSGFWQLLVVTMLALAVIAIAARLAPRETPSDRLWIRLLLGGLAVLTLLIVASALSRMWAYEQAYGFTRLRLLVSVCELWLGIVFVIVLVAGLDLRRRARWVPGAVVGTAVAALIAIVVLNPDRFVADRNVTRYAETGRVDYNYLASLSADAVPALMRLPEPLRSCALDSIATDLQERPDEWRQWNLARHQARRLLAAYERPTADEWRRCDAVPGRDSP